MTVTRRRGQELEEAILDAAWEQFRDGGYAALTMESVAARAGTSKPVLYRRWPDRETLLHAALGRAIASMRFEVPDTGSLRADLLSMMTQVNETLVELAAVMAVRLLGYFEETGTNPTQLRSRVHANPPADLAGIWQRAVERGEVDPDRLTARIKQLPLILLRDEALMTMEKVPAEDLAEILDTVVLPLVLR